MKVGGWVGCGSINTGDIPVAAAAGSLGPLWYDTSSSHQRKSPAPTAHPIHDPCADSAFMSWCRATDDWSGVLLAAAKDRWPVDVPKPGVRSQSLADQK